MMKSLLLVIAMMSPVVAMQQGVTQPIVLSGDVSDNDGYGIGGAKAVLLDCATSNVLKETISDPKGRFTLTPDGEQPTYCVQFSKAGFQTFRLKIEGATAATKIHVKLGTA